MTARGVVAEQLASLVGCVCDVPSDAIGVHSRLRGFGLDSVRATELIVLIEDDFGVQFRMEDFRDVQTLGDLARAVTLALAGRNATGTAVHGSEETPSS